MGTLQSSTTEDLHNLKDFFIFLFFGTNIEASFHSSSGVWGFVVFRDDVGLIRICLSPRSYFHREEKKTFCAFLRRLIAEFTISLFLGRLKPKQLK